MWIEVAKVVTKIALQPLTWEECQGKLEALKKKWNLWSRLMLLSGFGRDEATGVPSAPDYVWGRRDPHKFHKHCNLLCHRLIVRAEVPRYP